jgi:acyl-[acyl-carrier-protein]-phospholipid O-acyltransferase/long-chain-fatty-acid--[acyl-carrier-protein] ligase
MGAVTFAATAYAIYLLPDVFLRFLLWLLTHTLYRIRVVGRQHIPLNGPALLISNHVSFVDAFMIGASLPRFVHFMLHRDYFDNRWLNWLFRLMRAIPVSANNRRDIVESLRRARSELAKGNVVCIFAEGAISRTGRILPFKRGFEKIVEGTDAPIIPVHLDRLWGSIFSFSEGRFFWKWPKRIFEPVTVSFGTPTKPGASVHEMRGAVLELESDAYGLRSGAGEHQIYPDRQAALVVFLHGRYHGSRAQLRQGSDRRSGTCALAQEILRPGVYGRHRLACVCGGLSRQHRRPVGR